MLLSLKFRDATTAPVAGPLAPQSSATAAVQAPLAQAPAAVGLQTAGGSGGSGGVFLGLLSAPPPRRDSGFAANVALV